VDRIFTVVKATLFIPYSTEVVFYGGQPPNPRRHYVRRLFITIDYIDLWKLVAKHVVQLAVQNWRVVVDSQRTARYVSSWNNVPPAP
jgi:hypothetical protein